MNQASLRATIALLLAAAPAPASAYDREDWPVHYTFGDGTDVGLTAVYRYDINQFSEDRRAGGSAAFEDSHTNRRKELGLTLRKKGVYEAIVDYEYQGKSWLDTNVRVQSRPFLGTDIGAFRFGYSKTPVSFEGVTGTKATSFLELALPAQAIFEGRRTGIDWQFERPAYIVNLGYYWGQDLLGDNDGTTVGGRVAWTPRKAEGDVVHLGFSTSREDRDGTTDGRGVHHDPSVRLSTPPETGLTPVRLVDTGSLSKADRVDRSGFEALWIAGPWSVQGELLRADVSRFGGNPDFAASGGYVFGSWVLTGESRPYSGGNVGNIKPKGRWGAWELLLRYSALDLNDGPVRGGKEHDWTLGANWYLTQHFKFQANYIQATSDKGNLSLDPRIFELRAQIQF
ncbi:MAG: OprO/OprP family phosphate-selective porin [Dokdonella sp.]|uniref:OprO/OprP family phosphate-selective porin n=1 Tax=Dokdonella sp. TaxID=2291710 RepID=UPI003F80F882